MVTYEELRNPMATAEELIEELNESLKNPQGDLNKVIREVKNVALNNPELKLDKVKQKTIKESLTDIDIMKALTRWKIPVSNVNPNYDKAIIRMVDDLIENKQKYVNTSINLTNFARSRDWHIQISLEELLIHQLLKNKANPMELHYLRDDIRELGIIETILTTKKSAKTKTNIIFDKAMGILQK